MMTFWTYSLHIRDLLQKQQQTSLRSASSIGSQHDAARIRERKCAENYDVTQ